MRTTIAAGIVLVLTSSGIAKAQQTPACGSVRVQVQVPSCGQQLPPPPPATSPPPPVYQPSPAPGALAAPSLQPTVHRPARHYTARLGIGLDIFPFSLDVALSNRLSLSANFLFLGVEEGYVAGLLAGLDYYILGGNLRGLFVGGRIGYVGVGVWGEDGGPGLVTARALFGYTWIWDSFFLSLEGGLQYFNLRDDFDCYDCSNRHGTGVHVVVPHAALRIGAAF